MSSTKHLLKLLIQHMRWIELFNIGLACTLLIVGHTWWASVVVVGILLWQILLIVQRSTEGLVASTIALLRTELRERLSGCPAPEDSDRSE